MNELSAEEIIKSVRDLPSLSALVMELLSSFEQQNVSIGDLAEKIAHDQSLTAKALRIANSSFYGLSRRVTTIQQAITVLGFDSVRTLISAAAITEVFSASTHQAFDFQIFWKHAIGTALCAKRLAHALNLNQDFAFISALLHDIGKLVLVTRFPEEYSEVIAYRVAHDCYMLEAERAVLGTDHTVVGRALAEHWKFPLIMQKTIANHHAPTVQDLADIPGVVHLADAIVHGLGLNQQEQALVPVLNEQIWDRMIIAPEALRRVFYETESEFEETCQILAF